MKRALLGLVGIFMAVMLGACAASIDRVDGQAFKSAAEDAGFTVQDSTADFQEQVGDDAKVEQGYQVEGDDGSLVQFVDFEDADDAKILYEGWKQNIGISEDDAKSYSEQNVGDSDIYSVSDGAAIYRIIRTDDTVTLGAALVDSAGMMNKTMDALGK